MKTIFKEVEEHIKHHYNSNFHFDKLDWTTQEWLKVICRVVERRIKGVYKEEETEE